MRRTILVCDVKNEWRLDDLMDYFSRVGPVKYARWAEKNDKTYAVIEFLEQKNVIDALKLHGTEFKGSLLNICHSTDAIVNPKAKSNKAAQSEIEEAMSIVKEAQSMISAAIDPVIGMLAKDKRCCSRAPSRSRERHHSRSCSRRRSRSRRHSCSRPRSTRSCNKSPRRRTRSRSRRCSRSRRSASRRRSRSQSRHRTRSRSRKRSRSRDRKRSHRKEDKSRRSRSRSRHHSRSRRCASWKQSRSLSRHRTRSRSRKRSRSHDRKRLHHMGHKSHCCRSRVKHHSLSHSLSSRSKDAKTESRKSKKMPEESIVLDCDAEEELGQSGSITDDKQCSPKNVENCDEVDISESP